MATYRVNDVKVGPGTCLIVGLFLIALVVGLVAAETAAIWWLWNDVVQPGTGGPKLTFWQVMGISALVTFLFGHIHRGGKRA